MEIIFELLLEFLLQIAIEVLTQIGLHSVAEPFRKAPNPWLAALGYGLLGGFLGVLSLMPFPSHMVTTAAGRIANLILTPLAVGLCMAALGNWRQRHHAMVLRIDRFSYGFLFALAIALPRYFWAQ